MRSIWTESAYSPPHNRNTSTSPKPIDQINRSPPPHRQQQLYALSFPLQHRNDSHHLPSFTSTPLPNGELIKEDNHHHYPPAMDPDWPGSRYDSRSFDHEVVKRRKLSLSTKNHQPPVHHIVNPSITTTSSTSTVTGSNSNSTNANTVRTRLATTDTYYHQSRRKKRDTKPPNANDIRPFVEVEKAKDGSYILPAEVDSWTVLSLGTVIWDKAAFHNQRYIYPVGYRVKK